MAAYSQYFDNAFLNQLLRGVAYTFPTTLYIALCTTTPTATSTGSTIVEPAGGSYARVSITPGTGLFAAPSAGSTSNSGTISFAASTASWGTITAIAICDAATVGNMIAFTALTTSITVGTNTTVSFQAASLTATQS